MTTDTLGVVHDFLEQILDLPSETIVRGWQSRAALPDDPDFVVLTLLETVRHGTRVHTWTPVDDATAAGDATATPTAATATAADDATAVPTAARLLETVSMLIEYCVRVDFCGTDEAAVMARAARLALFAGDAAGVAFFRARGLSCLYADAPVFLPYSDEMKQWVTRCCVTLHLSGWVRGTIEHEAFSDVTVTIENVDVHHPVTE